MLMGLSLIIRALLHPPGLSHAFMFDDVLRWLSYLVWLPALRHITSIKVPFLDSLAFLAWFAAPAIFLTGWLTWIAWGNGVILWEPWIYLILWLIVAFHIAQSYQALIFETAHTSRLLWLAGWLMVLLSILLHASIVALGNHTPRQHEAAAVLFMAISFQGLGVFGENHRLPLFEKPLILIMAGIFFCAMIGTLQLSFTIHPWLFLCWLFLSGLFLSRVVTITLRTLWDRHERKAMLAEDWQFLLANVVKMGQMKQSLEEALEELFLRLSHITPSLQGFRIELDSICYLFGQQHGKFQKQILLNQTERSSCIFYDDANDEPALDPIIPLIDLGIEAILTTRTIRRQANKDALTGFYNRNGLIQLAPIVLSQCIREQWPMSVVMIDIDYFKRINDSLGHAAGDKVLKELAQRIESACRDHDILARYGGDEFLLLLPGVDCHQALRIMQRITTQLKEVPLLSLDRPVTLSAGIAGDICTHSAQLQAWQQLADRALYQAKARGRNAIVLADELEKIPLMLSVAE